MPPITFTLTWLQHPYLLAAARGLLATIFLASALGKLRDRRAFAAVVLDYRVLPARWARRWAAALPWIESGVGVMLTLGLGTRMAAGLSGVLLLGFIAAVGFNLLRGRRDLDCGCAGARRRRTIDGWVLARNAILLGLSLQVAWWGSPVLALDDWLERLIGQTLSSEAVLALSLILAGLSMLYRMVRLLTRLIESEARR